MPIEISTQIRSNTAPSSDLSAPPSSLSFFSNASTPLDDSISSHPEAISRVSSTRWFFSKKSFVVITGIVLVIALVKLLVNFFLKSSGPNRFLEWRKQHPNESIEKLIEYIEAEFKKPEAKQDPIALTTAYTELLDNLSLEERHQIITSNKSQIAAFIKETLGIDLFPLDEEESSLTEPLLPLGSFPRDLINPANRFTKWKIRNPDQPLSQFTAFFDHELSKIEAEKSINFFIEYRAFLSQLQPQEREQIDQEIAVKMKLASSQLQEGYVSSLRIFEAMSAIDLEENSSSTTVTQTTTASSFSSAPAILAANRFTEWRKANPGGSLEELSDYYYHEFKRASNLKMEAAFNAEYQAFLITLDPEECIQVDEMIVSKRREFYLALASRLPSSNLVDNILFRIDHATSEEQVEQIFKYFYTYRKHLSSEEEKEVQKTFTEILSGKLFKKLEETTTQDEAFRELAEFFWFSPHLTQKDEANLAFVLNQKLNKNILPPEKVSWVNNYIDSLRQQAMAQMTYALPTLSPDIVSNMKKDLAGLLNNDPETFNRLRSQGYSEEMIEQMKLSATMTAENTGLNASQIAQMMASFPG